VIGSGQRNTTILVVDDDPDIRDALVEILALHGSASRPPTASLPKGCWPSSANRWELDSLLSTLTAHFD
jgi:CheY-like chemotaxis protein